MRPRPPQRRTEPSLHQVDGVCEFFRVIIAEGQTRAPQLGPLNVHKRPSYGRTTKKANEFPPPHEYAPRARINSSVYQISSARSRRSQHATALGLSRPPCAR